MRPIPPQLFHQTEFPIEISLHGAGRIVSTFIGTAIAVDARREQMGLAFFQRQAGL